ncbi:MAG: uroporphyrinogen decarboxylase family protein [Spirochaetaceae bacterium]|jgi:hypothetical protein|nr:uroporphyrinogen decarboxylase family protein [Spirochaetaceae bacterium]
MNTLNPQEINRRVEAVWRLEEADEVPFVVEVGPLHVATKDFYDDDEAELRWHIQMHKQRENVRDYGYPNIKPNQGVNIVAAAFGCEQTVNDVADPWVKAFINEDNAEAVHTLQTPDPVNNPVYQHAWRRLDWLQRHSDWPLRMVNVPSPLTTASLIWDYTNFIEALLVCPDEVHVLMEKVTQAIILYVKEQFKRIKNLYSVGHESMCPVPRCAGVRVSDDTGALLSPSLYREFGVKYNGLISKEFGGIVVHSCGDTHSVVPAMMEIPGLKGLDLTIPQVQNWEAVRDAAAGKTVLCLRHQYWDHLEGETDMIAYTKKIVDCFGRKGVVIQTSAPTEEEAVAYSEQLHRLLS